MPPETQNIPTDPFEARTFLQSQGQGALLQEILKSGDYFSYEEVGDNSGMPKKLLVYTIDQVYNRVLIIIFRHPDGQTPKFLGTWTTGICDFDNLHKRGQLTFLGNVLTSFNPGFAPATG